MEEKKDDEIVVIVRPGQRPLQGREVEELRVKAHLALRLPVLVWAARMASSPTAAHEMAVAGLGGDGRLAKATRFLAMIKRDHGLEALEAVIGRANIKPLDALGSEEGNGIARFACLCAEHKQKEWVRWTQDRILARTLPGDVLAFLAELYDWYDDEGYDRYEGWGLRPYDLAAYELFRAHIAEASDWEILQFLEIGMIPDGADPFVFDGDVHILRERRPSVELCVHVLKNADVLFQEDAWALLQVYFAVGQITPDAWLRILDELVKDRRFKSDGVYAAIQETLHHAQIAHDDEE